MPPVRAVGPAARRRSRLLLLVLASASAVASTVASTVAAADEASVESAIRARMDAALAAARAADGNAESVAAAADEVRIALDQVLFCAPIERTGPRVREQRRLLVDAVAADRLMSMVRTLDPPVAAGMLRLSGERPAFVRALLFTVVLEREDADSIAPLALRLARERPDAVDPWANLAAAVCVVHDRPMERRVNEHRARSLDPLAIFDYFSRYEQHMRFGTRRMPPELLVHVVDTTLSADELRWSQQTFGRVDDLASLYFHVAYDIDHFRTGAPKAVSRAGWNLRNIHRHGGVCADQAYFATEVAKAFGVPAAYTVGRGAGVGHAWVGILRGEGGRAWWDADTGRYVEYQGVRGRIIDPQLRRVADESDLVLRCINAAHADEDRQFAAATVFGVRRLHELLHFEATGRGTRGVELAVSPPVPGVEHVRTATVSDRLELVETGLRVAPGHAQGWHLVAGMARAGELDEADVRRWAEVLQRLCGDAAPSFHCLILCRLIGSIEDRGQQDQLWNRAFEAFAGRPDLAAEIRMHQASMWSKAGDDDRAGRLYLDVIDRFVNSGPFVISALRESERILRERRQGDRLLALYDRAWNAVRRPEGEIHAEFVRGSNWYRIGERYAAILEEAGRGRDAAAVRRRLGAR